jgi:hypothetical protein
VSLVYSYSIITTIYDTAQDYYSILHFEQYKTCSNNWGDIAVEAMGGGGLSCGVRGIV